MYQFLQRFLPRSLANVLMALWYLLLMIACIYGSLTGEEGEFRYADW